MDSSGSGVLVLFGGNKGWHAEDWTSSDDRVRGGKSQSYLSITEDVARFNGNLDIKTLGGAGFASQRTTGEDREWDLSAYKGLLISVAKGDKKRYTITLKDKLLPKDPKTGREQSTISYECDFELPPQTEPGETKDRTVFIPWKSLNATFRGRLKDDADPIDLKKIKRVSLMIRSFFGAQEGDFSLSIRSITALSKVPELDILPLSAAVTVGSKGFSATQDSRDIEKSASDGIAPSAPPSRAPSGSARLMSFLTYLILLLGMYSLASYVFTGDGSLAGPCGWTNVVRSAGPARHLPDGETYRKLEGRRVWQCKVLIATYTYDPSGVSDYTSELN